MDGDGLAGGFGIRVGIVARETAERGMAGRARTLPGGPEGQITHRLAIAVSDSHWHGQLSDERDPA